MPPSDQEPRYQLVDSNGNVVGSFFGDGSGNVVIADETDTQTTFGPDGITTPALEADILNGRPLTPSGDVAVVGVVDGAAQSSINTTSSTYVSYDEAISGPVLWSAFAQDLEDIRVRLITTPIQPGDGETVHIRIEERFSSTTLASASGTSGTLDSGWTDPGAENFSTLSVIAAQVRTDPGTNSTRFREVTVLIGVQQ